MTAKKLEKNQVLARLDKLRISTQKLNLIVDMIRGKNTIVACNILSLSKKKAARDIKKLLDSAIANAEYNNNLNINCLVIKEVWTGKSLSIKRFMPCGRGKGGVIVKPFSNATIILEEQESA